MKKFLLSITLFSFIGFGTLCFNTNRNMLIAEASIVEDLGNPTVYYTPKGGSFHLDRNCSRLSRSKTVNSGKLSSIISSKDNPCDFCVLGTYTSKNNVSSKNTSQNNKLKLNVNDKELRSYLENSYKKAFERSIDDEGLNYWVNQLSQGKITIKDFILNLVGSDEFNNSGLSDREKIERVYGVMFGRDADDDGLNYWVSEFNKNLKNTNKKNIVPTVREMMKSDELKQIANKIGILY